MLVQSAGFVGGIEEAGASSGSSCLSSSWKDVSKCLTLGERFCESLAQLQPVSTESGLPVCVCYNELLDSVKTEAEFSDKIAIFSSMMTLKKAVLVKSTPGITEVEDADLVIAEQTRFLDIMIGGDWDGEYSFSICAIVDLRDLVSPEALLAFPLHRMD